MKSGLSLRAAYSQMERDYLMLKRIGRSFCGEWNDDFRMSAAAPMAAVVAAAKRLADHGLSGSPAYLAVLGGHRYKPPRPNLLSFFLP
jgi:hypothetical protein